MAEPVSRRQAQGGTSWTRVGANAELLAWPDQIITGCPYPLDLALERYYTGKTIRYGAIVQQGADSVTADLADWFARYNARQTIGAGVKEGKPAAASLCVGRGRWSGCRWRSRFRLWDCIARRWTG